VRRTNSAVPRIFAKLEDESFLRQRTIYVKLCNKKFAKSLPKIVYVLRLPTQKFISQRMPENKTPAAQPEPEAAPGEFDFGKPTARIKRRSLKAKSGIADKPTNGTKPPASEVEREVASLPGEQPTKPQPKETADVKSASATKAAETPLAPPRTLPATATPSSQAASASSASATTSSQTKPSPTASPTTSPHGTRPATLYYSSSPRKEGTPTPMKTVPTASPASASSSTASATARPTVAASSSARPAGGIDYRANVERQSREQKSVGNLLSYIVYGFIALFVLVVGLAGYGADVIFKQLHDESATVSDLDARYAAANKDLNAKLVTTQDTLGQAQAQIARQQELIMKQQEDLNKLIAATTDTTTALKQEKQARAQEAASLRARVRDLEDRVPQKL
jgi:hypothetical protein